MIVDNITNWRNYRLGEAWEKAFGFLESLTSGAEEKEYPLDGDELFARVMSYPSKLETDEDAVLEAHRKFADIQMVLGGAERIAVYPTDSLASKAAYDEERDVEFFQYSGPADLQATLRPGTFVLLLPQDAHMPQLAVGEAGALIEKVVVKVPMSRLLLG